MRMILLSGIAVLILAATSYALLNVRQTPSGTAYTSRGARIDQYWSWRNPSTEQGAHASCEARNAWQWIFVDFHDPAGEPPICTYSQ
jgi:hypothetical protein